LNSAGWSAPKLAIWTQLQSVHNDLDRFEQLGIEGLADGKATGAQPKVTLEIETFMHTKLVEDRVWNSTCLARPSRRNGVSLKRETIRIKLLELGYSWKRTRYAPGRRT